MSVSERVERRVAEFKVGNIIAGFRDDVELEGEIITIRGYNALIKTQWGNVTVSLTTARWL